MNLRALLICLMVLLQPAAAHAGEALSSLAGVRTLDVSPKQFDNANIKGKPVIVAFFASWCPPCIGEFSEISKAQAALSGKDVAFIGVNLFENWSGDSDPARMARFLAKTSPNFPLVQGSEDIAFAFGQVDRIPTLVVFDAAGNETWRFVHARGASKTHATADEIIAALK